MVCFYILCISLNSAKRSNHWTVTSTSIQICVKEGCRDFFHTTDFHMKFIYLIPWTVSHISLGLGQHQMKPAGHNHALLLLSVMNFKLADALKKKKKIYLKSSAKSERLNIITKNTNPVLTYLRLWPEKRGITTADVVFYWEYFLGWKYKATGLQTQKHATTEIHFCTRKIGWLNYFNSVKLLIFLKLCFRRVVPRNNRGQIKCCRIRTRGIWGKYGTEEQHLLSCL